MRIQRLYFDGCTNVAEARQVLNAGLSVVGVKVKVEHIRVRNASDAQRLRFLGSPSIRIDDRDVEPEADARRNYGFMCRTYRYGDKMSGVPSHQHIAAALIEALANPSQSEDEISFENEPDALADDRANYEPASDTEPFRI